ncbi:MAG TPA: GH116 family glycosyl-hydrolase [Terriglobales bacterium]|nr:GH116 family glycosyl-hydrolase [Terriglobales bacterium]
MTPEEARNPKNFFGFPDSNTPARVKKGIPLGGIGAGNFMYNICGSFGPWIMKAGRYEERFLSQAAFHIWESVEGDEPIVRTLATHDVLSAWKRLDIGQADYHALFPKGWVTYRGFANEISMEFFSPIIKDNYRETSLPVGLFEFRVHNPLKKPTKLAIMFTFPNAPYTGPRNLNPAPLRFLQASLLECPRNGLSNSLIHREKITAILMKAEDAQNPPETQNSEWCIATDRLATYITGWDGAGNGSDVWEDFASDGRLQNLDQNGNSQLPSGALCVQIELGPGGTATIPFSVAWFFPEIQFGRGTRWWRRYTEYFPAGIPRQSFEIAAEALAKGVEWGSAVDAWQQPIISTPQMPDWLKQAALNELYYTTFGSSFWENGCITKPKEFGNRPGQHISFVAESIDFAWFDPLDVRHFTSRSYRDLWPQIERDALLTWGDFIVSTKDGHCPHDEGRADGDPIFEYSGHRLPATFGGQTWSDYSPKFIQCVHALWVKTKDDEFLNEIWPATLKTFDFMMSITDRDGLSRRSGSEYEQPELYNAVLWMGAMGALEQMAQHKRDSALVGRLKAQLNKTRETAEKTLWSEQCGFYQYNARRDALMADGTLGERFVDVTGLEPVLDPTRLTSHYQQIFKRLVVPLKDYNGDGIGDMGIANCLNPDSTPAIGVAPMIGLIGHMFNVWAGVTYCTAANMYHWGKRVGDSELMKNALLAAKGAYFQSWQNEETAFWFSTPEAWRIEDPTNFVGPQYQRPRAIWELAAETGVF